MNPVENEAVLAAAIDRCGGSEKVEILPTDTMLPGLKRRPGMKKWTIMGKGGQVFSNHDEVKEGIRISGPSFGTDRLAETMFPPEEDLPLERAMRVYAHLQDTGGFFIAVLEKKSEFRARPEGEPKKPVITAIVNEIESKPTPAPGENVAPKIDAADALVKPAAPSLEEVTPAARQNQENPASDATLPRKRSADEQAIEEVTAPAKKLKTDEPSNGDVPPRQVHLPPSQNPYRDNTETRAKRGGQQFEEPFKYIHVTHPEVQSIETFYSLSPRFPRDRFMVRNAEGEPAKTIYYTSALIRDILTENEGKGIKFIHGGVKMFMKQDVQGHGTCKWRIQSEGMPILEGYVGESRIVRLYKRETLRKLLIEMFPKVSDGGWEALGEIGEHVNKLNMGCCVLRVEPTGEEDGFEERMVIPLWRSLHSLNLMLAKEDRSALLLRLFNDTSSLVNNSHPKLREAEKRAREAANGDKVVVENEDEDGEEAGVKLDDDYVVVEKSEDNEDVVVEAAVEALDTVETEGGVNGDTTKEE
jgi:multisite-specific tRNA:(cytosine-C5)-methyltransferase